MLNEKGICKYLRPDNLCEIRLTPRKDRLDNFPELAVVYYERNCIGFPRYLSRQDPELLMPSLCNLGWPPESCGYYLEVADSG